MSHAGKGALADSQSKSRCCCGGVGCLTLQPTAGWNRLKWPQL